jgi:hypothetical protein
MHEQIFKQKLIDRFNKNAANWIDGDSDLPNERTPDIINHSMKVVIEIKDDTKYKFDIPKNGEIGCKTTNLSEKNRQFKNHLKDANKKFINYPDYKSVLLLRTEVVNFMGSIAEYIINGPTTYKKINGKLLCIGHPSTFWGNHDHSTKEVGAILFLGNNEYFYRQNTNPNVNNKRILKRVELEKIFGHKINKMTSNNK